MKCLAPLTALLVSNIGILEAQSVLTGIVREDSSGRPLAGVEVLIERGAQRSVTDVGGRYVVKALPAGRHSALFRLIGYRPVRLWVVPVEDTIYANVELIKGEFQLEPIVVTASQPRGIGAEAFAERRRMGFGRFIDSTELRRSEHLRLTDLLRRGTGIKVAMVKHDNMLKAWAEGTRQVRLGGGRCWMQVILDGTVLYASGWEHRFPPDFLRDFEIASFEAVEIYRSAAETPIEFGGAGAACGTIVLWSRRGP